VGVNSILRFKSKDAKLLFFICPSIAIVLLMLTASTYTHYLLFTIPWIATLISFGIIESITFNSRINKLVLNIFSLLVFLLGLLLTSITILSSFFEFNILNLNATSEFIFLLFGIFFIYVSFSMFLESEKEKKFLNIIKISLLQILLFSFLFASGIIGNPNNEIKNFIKINQIDNGVYAIEDKIASKTRRLLSFYLRDYINYDLNRLSSEDRKINLFLLEGKLNEISKEKTFRYEKIDNYKDLYLIKVYAN
jgi:hypothetical protein